MKKTKKQMLRDVVAQGPSKSGHIKNVDGYFFSRAMLVLKGTARKTGTFPEPANGNGAMVMPQRTGVKGCAYRYTSSPGLTLTRRRSVGRQGAPSPRTSRRLAVMPCRRESSCSRQNISRQAGGGGAFMDSKRETSNLATSR